MRRRRILVLCVLPVETHCWLASAAHVFPRAGRRSLFHRAVSHTGRSLAVQPSPPQTYRSRSVRIGSSSCHPHLFLSRFLRHGWAGLRWPASSAAVRTRHLDCIHHLGCGRLAYARRCILGGRLPCRRAQQSFPTLPSDCSSRWRSGLHPLSDVGHSGVHFHARRRDASSAPSTGLKSSARSLRFQAAQGAFIDRRLTGRRHRLATCPLMAGRLIRIPATANHALQRTAPRVTVAAISYPGVSRPSHLLL